MRKKKCKYGYPECVFDSVKYGCDHCYNTDIGSHMNKQTITYLRKCLRPLKEEQRLCLKAKEKKNCEHDCRATKMCPRYSVIKDLKELIDTEWEKIKKEESMRTKEVRNNGW